MRIRSKRLFSFSILIFTVFLGSCQIVKGEKPIALDYPIIPTPQEVDYGKEVIMFESVFVTSEIFENEAANLSRYFKEKGLEIEESGLKIIFKKQELSEIKNEESYKLIIDSMVTITASTSKGAFYGIQTLKQLFRIRSSKGILPEIHVKDWSAFKIRGFMHDTGRNFQSVEQLKEQIEVLAQYKYNVFHWHLTDNPGWRLESKKYPELQSDKVTSRHKGKFYSQEDFKEILTFCKERKITVIPEFDIPGHTEAFRKAFGIKSMKEEKVLLILLDLFDELCELASPEEMPYIHIGTDEVRNKEEYVSKDFILTIMNRVKNHNREVIVWKEGIVISEDTTSINQLWAQHEPRKGHRFIDSRANYINHLDPFAGMARLYFQQPCRQPQGGSLALGGVLCAWPDNNVGEERNILKQNPIYSSIVFYSDAIWKGRSRDYKEYWAKLPQPETQEFLEFKKFEEKVIAHRGLFFEGQEFQYIKQSTTEWQVIGPFDHGGDMSKSFPVERVIQDRYQIGGKEFKWTGSHVGGTIHLKHFFGFPALTKKKKGTFYAFTHIYSPDERIQDFWVGFQGWSRSSRRGGPTPNIGQWHTTNPKIWVNDDEVAPPVWEQPGLEEKASEIPFKDEDYFYRAPTKIKLKKGWNKVLLKIPHGGNSWKWMFTCMPINIEGNSVKEVKELKFNASLKVD